MSGDDDMKSDAWERVKARQDAKGVKHAQVEGPFNPATDVQDRIEGALEEFYDALVYSGMERAKVHHARAQVLERFQSYRLAEEEWSDFTRRCNYIEDELRSIGYDARALFDRTAKLQNERDELLEKLRRIQCK
jgi:predicted  nucleic acid-binding Zn-ribbon protein